MRNYKMWMRPRSILIILLQRPPPPVNPDADVERRERLGGLLSFYYREAARGGG